MQYISLKIPENLTIFHANDTINIKRPAQW